MTVIIDKNYLQTKQIRNNITTRSEVLAAEIADKYFVSNKKLYVGTKAIKTLPDIYAEDKSIGFEVRLCEHTTDFNYIDAVKELCEDNWDYDKYLLRLRDPLSAISKSSIRISHDEHLVTSAAPNILWHSDNWMYDEYKKSLDDKLTKFNAGHYCDCKNNSLILLNLQRSNGLLAAELLYKAYNEIKSKYKIHFINIYFVTTNGIFICNDKELKNLVGFTDNEFSKLVQTMNSCLNIE